MVGQVIPVKIKGMDRQAGLVACSCREALADVKEQLFDLLREGQVIDAVVRVVFLKTLHVDIGGGYLVEVPRRKATRSQARRLPDIFREGQTVKAKVIEVNKQSDTINVSLVDAEPDPWGSVNYFRGDKVYGWVAKITDKQVFVEVKPGVTGIAPLPLRGRLKRGEPLTCKVNKFDAGEKKLRLVIMPVGNQPGLGGV
jgi:small subunit ribosomal protein S1